MARTIASRLHIDGVFVAQTPLHVGGLGGDADTDLPLARNGAGRFYIPGTSFAGAMRAWCVDSFGEPATEKVWGYQKGEAGHASWIFVEDATIPDNVDVEIRDGVGIDRVLGSAAEQIKYDRAVLPRGTELKLNLTVDLASNENPNELARKMLGSLLGALEHGDVQIGASQTRGLGRLKLKKPATVREHSFQRNLGKQDDKPGILSLLRGELPVVSFHGTHYPRQRCIVTINWHPTGPLMVKAGMNGIGVDTLPLMSGKDGQLAMVLPGSSIKGALRSQAERIVRTLRLASRADREVSQQGDRFLRHTDIVLIQELFGSPGQNKDEAKKAPRLHLGRGALGVSDCFATSTVARELWQRITSAAPEASDRLSDLRQRLDEARDALKHWTAAFHVAIDRWTGGAAEGFLYSVLEPHAVTWEPMRLEIDPRRLPGLELQGLILLLLVLRDLSSDRIPLGFATHRGMGAIKVDSIRFDSKNCREPFDQLDGTTLENGSLTNLPSDFRQKLSNDWCNWCKSKEMAQ